MYLTIIKNGLTIDHRIMGMKLLSFRRSSLSPVNKNESIDGRQGLIPLGTNYDGRLLRASFFVEATNHLSFQSVIDDIYELFSTEEEISLIDSRQPDRQWNVKVTGAFGIDYLTPSAGQFEVEFISSSPYAESVTAKLKSTVSAK